MPKQTKSHADKLIEDLRDPEYALEYLNAALEDDSEEAEGRFLLALRYVTKARELPMKDVAESAGVGRQALYNSLSASGNPEFHTLRETLRAMGLKLAVHAR